MRNNNKYVYICIGKGLAFIRVRVQIYIRLHLEHMEWDFQSTRIQMQAKSLADTLVNVLVIVSLFTECVCMYIYYMDTHI